MKIFLAGLILIALTSFSHAQWFSLNSGTTNNLNGVCVVDPLNVFIAGVGGIILKTTDGGSTWSQSSPVPYTLYSISFCDQNTGLAVGDNGIILKTTDGGNVWIPINSGVTVRLKNVWLHSPNNATILQDGIKFMTTSNGGTTWNTHTTYGYPWTYSFVDMSYTNWGTRLGVFTGAGVLNDPPGGPFIRVMYISNNGTGWNNYPENTMYYFAQVSVLPNGRVFALEPGRIITSSTGTGGWEPRGTLETCNDLFFVNENSGTALKSNGIFRTSDGGWNWEKVSPLALKSVAFADSNIGYAIGGGGAIAKTLNGGVTKNYFPSELGNAYQSKYTYSHTDAVQTWAKYLITSDTLINGKRFVKFTQDSPGPLNINNWFYFDKENQKLFTKTVSSDSIRLAVDFNTAEGDSFLSYFKSNIPQYCTSLSDPGEEEYEIQFLQKWGLPTWTLETFTFKQDIGLTDYWYNYFNEIFESHEFASAIVNGISYNPINLYLTTLSPLENREVSAFPFIMSADFFSTLINWSYIRPPLIDTFYVKVIQIRGEDTLGVFEYPFNSSKLAFVTLIPEVGDKLLIKAFISDTSIYQNSDVYPDSGYAEILVLPAATDVEDQNKPLEFNLEQNYPNPFNPSCTIRYTIPVRSHVTLTIYDVMGNEIVTLVNKEKQQGIYTTEFNGAELSSGVYFYRLSASDRTEIKKMMFLK